MKRFIYTLVVLFLFVHVKSQTSQTKTATQVSAAYPEIWTNLNATSLSADDNSYMYIKKLTGSSTGHVFLSGFGFIIPTTATINNITLTVRKFATGNVVKDYYVSLLDENGCSKGPNLTKSTAAWPVSETDVTYSQAGSGTGFTGCGSAGGTTYTWSAAEINTAAFTVMIHAQKLSGKPSGIYLEKLTVTVDYTPITTSRINKSQTLATNYKRSIEIKTLAKEVMVTTPTAGKYTLIITDLRGLPLEQKIFYATENSPTIVPLKNTLSGVYFITCTGNGITKTIKSFLQ